MRETLDLHSDDIDTRLSFALLPHEIASLSPDQRRELLEEVEIITQLGKIDDSKMPSDMSTRVITRYRQEKENRVAISHPVRRFWNRLLPS